MSRTIKIGVVEDHSLFRELIVKEIKKCKDLKVVFNVNNGKELLTELHEIIPDIVLLDLETPIMSGSEVFKILRLKYKNIKIIILSAYFQEDYIRKYMKLGACAFLSKSHDSAQVIKAIKSVHESGVFHDKDVLKIINTKPKAFNSSESLSKAEIRVAKLLCEGKTTKEIALILKLSIDTIYYHRENIWEKIKSNNLATLYKYCIDRKIVNPL